MWIAIVTLPNSFIHAPDYKQTGVLYLSEDEVRGKLSELSKSWGPGDWWDRLVRDECCNFLMAFWENNIAQAETKEPR